VGRGTGFDAVHAAACLTFALAFGPALARSLRRFTLRLEVVWQAPIAPVLVAALGAAVLVGAAAPAARAATPASYLLAAQNPDGGFGPAPGQPSSPLYSGWAALGLAAEGINPATTNHGGRNLLAYVLFNPGGVDPGSIERTILAARAAGAAVPATLLGALEHAFAGDGAVSNQVNLTAFGVLALRAAGAPLPSGTVGWLLRQQDGDGGFSFATAGGGSDVDDTAAALEALAAAGAPGRAMAHAVGFIRSQQNPDGGFPALGASDSNAQSTAWAVQGLIAAGVEPASVHRPGRSDPLAYLDSLIAPDGHVRYSRGADETPVWVTAEAAMALAGKPLPLQPAPPARRPSVPHPGSATHAPRILRAHTFTLPPPRRQQTSRRTASRRAAARMTALAADDAVATALVLAPLGLG
jgi:energy-coupling factor transport system substrate-specific component